MEEALDVLVLHGTKFLCRFTASNVKATCKLCSKLILPDPTPTASIRQLLQEALRVPRIQGPPILRITPIFPRQRFDHPRDSDDDATSWASSSSYSEDEDDLDRQSSSYSSISYSEDDDD
jgi:hypothetical protein